jgi:hypothetical protein
MRHWDEHHRLADRLNATRCRWILSSYDLPEIRSLYPEAYITSVQSFSGMKAKKNESERVLNKEVLITNFLPPGQTSTQPVQIRLLEVTETYKS